MIEPCRQIHIHVADYVSLALQPRATQGASSASLDQVNEIDSIVFRRKFPGNGLRTVGRSVVDYDELPSVWHVSGEKMQYSCNALPQYMSFVQNGNDNVHSGGLRAHKRPTAAFEGPLNSPQNDVDEAVRLLKSHSFSKDFACRYGPDQITQTIAATTSRIGSGETPEVA